MQTYCCRACPSSTGTSFKARPQRGHGFRTWKTVFIGLPLLGDSSVGFGRRAQADCEKLAMWGGAGVKEPPIATCWALRSGRFGKLLGGIADDLGQRMRQNKQWPPLAPVLLQENRQIERAAETESVPTHALRIRQAHVREAFE